MGLTGAVSDFRRTDETVRRRFSIRYSKDPSAEPDYWVACRRSA